MDQYKLDSLDLDIIKLLEGDARRSSTELAKQLNTSAGTIRFRIRKLVKSNTIRFVALPNPNKIGLPLIALICMKVVNKRIDSIVRELFNWPEISWVASTIGRFEIICSARFSDNNALGQFLKSEVPKLEGVTAVEASIFLEFLPRNISGGMIEGWENKQSS